MGDLLTLFSDRYDTIELPNNSHENKFILKLYRAFDPGLTLSMGVINSAEDNNRYGIFTQTFGLYPITVKPFKTIKK